MDSPTRRATKKRLAIGAATLAIGSMLASPASAPAVPAPAHHHPVVTHVRPPAATTQTHPRVTIKGRGFRHVKRVWFGNKQGRHVRVASSRLLRVTPPRHPAGTVRVRVVTRGGHSQHARAAHFTYRELPVKSPSALVAPSPGSVQLGWTPSGSFDASSVVIRRATGGVAPASPQDGTLVAQPKTGVTHVVDDGLQAGERYSYAFFAESRSRAYSRSATLVTRLPQGRWQGTAVDPFAGDLAAVDCLPSGFCALGDATGHVLTYDGSAFTKPVRVPSSPGARPVTEVLDVSCGSATFCVANVYTGAGTRVSYFNGTSWSDARPFGNGVTHAGELHCIVGTTTCFGMPGFHTIVRYDGTTWSKSAHLKDVVLGLSCSTTTYCLALTNDQQVVTYDHGVWSREKRIPGAEDLDGVSCPPGVNDCTVLGTPPGGGSESFRLVDGVWKGFKIPRGALHLACATPTACLAIDFTGGASTFDGSTWQAVGPEGAAGQSDDLSCATATECIALDHVSGSGTNSPGFAYLWQGSSFTSLQPDPVAGAMTDVSCSSATSCMAVDASRSALGFDGTAWSAPTRLDTHPVGATSGQDQTSAVSCPTPGFCAAIFGNGYADTYDGSSWAAAVHVDPNVYHEARLDTPGEQHLECPSPAFCVVTNWTNVLTYDGTTWSQPQPLNAAGIYDLSCPTVSLCVAVDGAGGALTFDGTAWSAPTSDLLGTGPATVSCSTSSSCLAVGSKTGRTAAWNGTAWSRLRHLSVVDRDPTLRSTVIDVSCGSSIACTAVDSGGAAYEFDGRGWSAAVQVTRVATSPRASPQALSAVDCSSTDACVAVSAGNAYVTGP